MTNNMTNEQFRELISRFDRVDQRFEHVDGRLDRVDQRLDRLEERVDHIEERMVTRHDVFQAVFTVQGFTFAVIVGCIVVLSSVGLL